MPNGIASIAKVLQHVPEVTFGTAVTTATVRPIGQLAGTSFSVPDVKAQAEEIGRFYPSAMVVQTEQHAEGKVEQILTPEDGIYILGGVFNSSVGAAVSTYYPWTFTPPTTAAATPTVYTMEWAPQGKPGYRLTSCVYKGLNMKCDSKGHWTIGGDIMAQKAEAMASQTAAITEHTLNDGFFRASATTIAIDTTSSAHGTTAKTGLLRSFEFSVDTGRHMKYFMGSLYPGDWGESKWTGSLKTAVEWNADSKALFEAMLSGVVTRRIQIKAMAGATAYVTLQFTGYLDSVGELWKDEDGNMCLDLDWKPVYDSGFGNWCKVLLNGKTTATIA